MEMSMGGNASRGAPRTSVIYLSNTYECRRCAKQRNCCSIAVPQSLGYCNAFYSGFQTLNHFRKAGGLSAQ